ncbi:Uncharacterized protein CK203_054922 [Vitis vinifera]|uniref:Uncharacterized protein n=1 Tax=Vitis vinifera TaxID=29760 RepID=A0A438GJ57_VITVI|nr:Uncharacterized protein CK203_054922 [Vitis vinifera]
MTYLSWLLMWFEAISSLKINLTKNELILVRRVEDLEDLAFDVGCKVGVLPTTYLGLLLGASHNSLAVWDGVEERFHERLAMWKRQYISKGERLMLIRGTLASLPIYFISLFRMLRPEERGLGVRHLHSLNKALLGVGALKEVRGGYGVGLWKTIRKLVVVLWLHSNESSVWIPNFLRFDQSTKKDILRFILDFALKLSSYAKLRILSLLKGVGGEVMHIKDVELFLSELLRRRSQYHFGLNEPYQKLSKIEVEILCLLLEGCAVHASSVGGYGFEDHLLKALQLPLDDMSLEDPALVQPCITVLRKLNSPLYSGLKIEKQNLPPLVDWIRLKAFACCKPSNNPNISAPISNPASACLE